MGLKGLGKLGSKGTSKKAKAAGASLRAAAPLRTSSPPVAVDFGVGSLKVLQVTGAEPPALVAAASIDVPEEIQDDPARRLRFQLEALPKLVKQGGFKSVRAVCAIPAGQMFCKHLQIVKAEGVSRGEIARAAVAKQLGCDPGSLVCQHEEVKELSGGRAEVICFAAARELVGRMMQALKQARLEPVGIHSEPQALVRAMAPSGDADPVATLYLDIGRGTTSVVVGEGHAIRFSRVIAYGGFELDTAVSSQLKCTMARAGQRRLELDNLIPADGSVVDASAVTGLAVPGADEQGEQPDPSTMTHQAVRPIEHPIDLSEPMEILTDEISMCLRYHRSLFADAPVKRVVFVGGESRHRALCEHIARMLRLPAEIADPMARVARTGKEPATGLHLNEPQPGWAMPLGMCLSPTDL
ncbi:MAG: hypothetical protein DHS20C14_01450 [Phycisphaeraceae bacterium]|nr:MAG: hypothetical protein DHS20C14_01450 [Phycisphaeraceae bacterium]